MFKYLLLILFFSSSAHAYLGLGALLPLLGSSVLFVFGLVVSILGVIFYPIIKLLNNKKNKSYKKNKK